ncbi:conserved hypothetical protein [Hyella patelloides LEGE 07179]|uniref:GmrSD restriction endonucleases N-terminal domain-containing protein n=1 Tax=Hyella patelloides LEGE 07179 TaxID=945734 RepID=A0A563VW75_9CYAN|nr:DUF262 domain-containing protein [Hyella patelloides]VEP15666.1 conserved hypothetical protein [Hyella patelloides LEGE 07179]
MLVAPAEERMWEKSSLNNGKSHMTDEQINIKYEQGQQRILTEMNREKLPSFADSLKKTNYMDVSPFYQRRLRWDEQKQSQLIESFLINIPVPPIILYEREYNSYEVMDGQQRITAIKDFYNNDLELTGLEMWSELNGRTYQQLPDKIKAGIDRRAISSIVLITESTQNKEEAFFLKQITFERLNTGGVSLSKQEIRNCIYSGIFNTLLFKLANNSIFAKAWGIPLENKDKLRKNNLYKKMEDVELVLRFFAFRHANEFRNGIEGFLNLYMIKSLNFSQGDINILEGIFIETINLASTIYEDKLFKPFDVKTKQWKDNSYKAFYDAVMVGLSNHLNDVDLLIERKSRILEETKKLLAKDKKNIFTGAGRTKADLQERIKLFDEMLSQIIAE